MLVQGPAGIGKTSLLWSAREAEAQDVRVLSARGGTLETDLAFGIVAQLFEPLLRAAGPAQQTSWLASARPVSEVAVSIARMGSPPHHITDLAYDDDAGCAWWRCACGDAADGCDSVQEARFAAAEHQLPEDVQREIENDVPTGAVEAWRDAVTAEADAAAVADPPAWTWYLAPTSDRSNGTTSGAGG